MVRKSLSSILSESIGNPKALQVFNDRFYLPLLVMKVCKHTLRRPVLVF